MPQVMRPSYKALSMNKLWILGGLFLIGCHPFFMFKPASLKSVEKDLPPVEVAIDNFGIPFIKAKTIDEAIYGLGFMHARDRLFQIDLIRHAALGKTSELLGEKGLGYDRKLRLLSYKLDEQLLYLSDEENHLIDVYLKGVNEGAKKRGLTAEHFLLGTTFKDLSKRDVVAIARLQSWQLGADLFAEITRLKIARSKISDAKKIAFISPVDDLGMAIIAQKESDKSPWIWPSYLSAQDFRSSTAKEPSPLFGDGASNAWAVKSTLMDDGFATLMNDPHLAHNWPSNFYLATIEGDDLFVTGASFVGLPGIVIGSSRNVSWGVTASALNTQDAVLLKKGKKGHTYEVAGKTYSLEKWPQTFCVKDKCKEELYYTSIYGPVIDHEADPWVDLGDIFAIQWTGFRVEMHSTLSSGFLKLALTKNVKDAVSVVKTMTLPGVNLVLADTKGDIAYAYAGLVPKRDHSQNPYLPLDGSRTTTLWSSFLDKPTLIDPKNNYIITANQNIFTSFSAHGQYGQQGAPAFRAKRIDKRIKDMLLEGPLNLEKLSSVQLDETSSEAEELAPIIGKICLELVTDSKQKAFIQEVMNFNGSYTTKSTGALPYEYLMDEIVKAELEPILGADALGPGQYLRQPNYVVKRSFAKNGFLASEELKPRFKKACEHAFMRLVDKAGTKVWNWRWGRHHYLARQSILAQAPLVGSFFKDKKREVAGTLSAPMAEVGLPVKYGANLRLKVKMTSPPKVYAVLDSGNSGTVGDKHAYDQAKIWHEGGFIELPTSFEQTASWNKFKLE